MINVRLKLLLGLLILVHFHGFSTPKYNQKFFAAQKFFYKEALIKYPKLAADRAYPEVPVKGGMTPSELKNIEALTDVFEAKAAFAEEIGKYPEELLPEIFRFLMGHPALKVTPSDKQRFAALEKYFMPFLTVLCEDQHYGFNAEMKVSPCPLVVVASEKKPLTFGIYNLSKETYEFILNETKTQPFLKPSVKLPLKIKNGGNGTLKLEAKYDKTKPDSIARLLTLPLYDPAKPKLKLLVPVVVLPSKAFLIPISHPSEVDFQYVTHYRHIMQFSEKSSWPEPCPNDQCGNVGTYSLHDNNLLWTEYGQPNLYRIQYNLSTTAARSMNRNNHTSSVNFEERGELWGAGRHCKGADGSEVICPPKTADNGAELYGSRVIGYQVTLSEGQTHDLAITVTFSDLRFSEDLRQIEWLQGKRVFVAIYKGEDEIDRKLVNRSGETISFTNLTAGEYRVTIFTGIEDSKKPSIDVYHLNQDVPFQFDFKLAAQLTIRSRDIVVVTKKK